VAANKAGGMKPEVVVAMSGGVDSSVAAAVLAGQGRSVVGIGLKLAEPTGAEPGRSCCGLAEMEDARRVAEHIGIPFYVLNFTAEFREAVIDYFTSSYLRAETPNPCVPCNAIIKFDLLMARALGLGAGHLATGHYAIASYDERAGRYALRKGIDHRKDQTYFLYSLTQEQLARAVFPLGSMTKDQTREVARDLGLKVHDKVESQDVCFVGDEGYQRFVEMAGGAALKEGPILDENGNVLGTHQGLYRYTIGQRKGLGLESTEAFYVVEMDPAANSITVAPADRLVRQQVLVLRDVNYVSVERPAGPLEVEAVTRYRKEAAAATLTPSADDRAVLEFDKPQEPTAPGQSVVMYGGDRVLCGGIATGEARER
jgi:tRNA-uridine 2-sulfurtransferase